MTLASKIFLSSIPLLINLYASRYREQDKLKEFPDEPLDFGLPVEKNFDFIIVGGGTAGCILARRLSDAKFTVLLLEAGGNPPPLQNVPFVASITKDLEEINFLYQSIPQKNAYLINDGIVPSPSAKMMGGGSSHNDMIYERGHPLDYDHWAKEVGDSSWRYSNILKYFKKAQNYMGKFRSNGQQGHGGPMTVTRPLYAPGRSAWLKAGKEMGYKVIDSNGPQEEGFSPMEFTKKFGRRVSTYSAYIEGIEKTQKRLTVQRYALVSKILIHEKVAIGVLYSHHGVPRMAKAKKEVILTAGAFMSPILLIKSGIGPPDQLKKAKVDPVSILPGVGENMVDHGYLEVSPIFVSDHSKVWEVGENLTFNDFSNFLHKGDGPLVTSFRVGQMEAFIASQRGKSEKWPDLQLYYNFMSHHKKDLSCFVGLNRPLSRGRLTLNESVKEMDSPHLPILDFQYYSEDSDFDVMIEGIKVCLDVFEKAPAFQKIGAKFTTKPIRHCETKKFRSDDYWRCYARQMTGPSFHVVGTCKMGKKDDEMAVVDSKLRVFGVKGLRVADASIMPIITNANTAIPTVMIGEKAASQIIKQYRRKRYATGARESQI